MPCERNSFGVICYGRQRRRRCRLCGEGWVALECDFVVGEGKTCDEKMCTRCATRIRGKGVSLDYCPKHKEPALARLRAGAGAQ